jgi:hypothetical protein
MIWIFKILLQVVQYILRDLFEILLICVLQLGIMVSFPDMLFNFGTKQYLFKHLIIFYQFEERLEWLAVIVDLIIVTQLQNSSFYPVQQRIFRLKKVILAELTSIDYSPLIWIEVYRLFFRENCKLY